VRYRTKSRAEGGLPCTHPDLRRSSRLRRLAASACPHPFGSAQTPDVEAPNLDSEFDNALRKESEMTNFAYNSLWGILILAGDLWAIINILQSRASGEKKLIWTIAVVLLPVVGLVLWYFLGPRNRNAQDPASPLR
jgi:hypothetical protein